MQKKAGYIGHRDRLRKRIISGKTGTFFDYELLEFLLFCSHIRKDVKPLAKLLLEQCGGFSQVFSAEIDQLRKIEGMNDTSIAMIKVVKESLHVILKADFVKKPILDSWNIVLDYLRASMGSSKTEMFRMLFLDKKYRLIEDCLQEIGTVDQTPLYIREVIKKALSVGALAIVISHNHPSQECKPSKADIRLTEKLQQACANVNIELVDHVIITATKHFSFASNGLL